MAKIPRVFQPIFAATAANNGQFGSAQAGTFVISTLLPTIMALPAWGAGWLSAVVGGSKFPPLEEFQSIHYVTTTQLAYLFQEGIAEYDATTNYFINGIVKKTGTLQLYGSLTNNNAGNALTDPTNWKLLIDLGSISTGIIANPQVAAGYAPVAADSGKIIERSNAGATMADVIPGTSGALVAGWYAYLENIDATAQDSITVGAGGSISVGSSPTANAFVVAPGETWLIISLGTGNYIAMRISSATLHTKPVQGSHKNLKGTWSSNTTATYTADGIVLYDATGNSKLIQSFSQALNTGTTGIGGLSTGALAASTWYAVYAAFNPASGVQGIFFDPSFTSPTLPAGYKYSALIGAIRTDGSSNLIGFKQFDNRWQYVVGNNLAAHPVMASGVTAAYPTPSAVAVANFMPSAAYALQGFVGTGTSGTSQGCWTNLTSASIGGGSNGDSVSFLSTSAAFTGTGYFDMIVEGASLYWASNGGTGFFVALGFTLNL